MRLEQPSGETRCIADAGVEDHDVLSRDLGAGLEQLRRMDGRLSRVLAGGQGEHDGRDEQGAELLHLT